jgi:hypothetical protein
MQIAADFISFSHLPNVIFTRTSHFEAYTKTASSDAHILSDDGMTGCVFISSSQVDNLVASLQMILLTTRSMRLCPRSTHGEHWIRVTIVDDEILAQIINDLFAYRVAAGCQVNLTT